MFDRKATERVRRAITSNDRPRKFLPDLKSMARKEGGGKGGRVCFLLRCKEGLSQVVSNNNREAPKMSAKMDFHWT